MKRLRTDAIYTWTNKGSWKLSCLNCGELFNAHRRDAETCSPSCRQRLHRMRRKLRRSGNPFIERNPLTKVRVPKIK